MMKSVKRRPAIVAMACLGLSAALSSGLASAQADFPNRAIKIIVPYSAGSGSDAIARTVANSMTDQLGKQTLVENREGGGSLIGTLAVARAPADGYTLLMAANPTVIRPSQSAQPPYDPVNDFVPVAKVAVIPLVLAVSTSLEIKDIKGFIAYAKANPGKLSYGSSGPGTISQQEMELLKQAAGLDIPEIPYKSTSQALTDVIGGTLNVFPVVVSSVAQHVRAGKVRALAVIDSSRSPLLPDVPAITEAFSAPGYSPTPVWYGFLAPAKAPKEAVASLEGLIKQVVGSPQVKERFASLGAQMVSVNNDQFLADLKSEYQKAGALARRLGTVR
jgi:tripartite-type tricarboxylate transporter receptor subunit TctC